MNTDLHQPVLLKQAIDALNIQAKGVYVDGTLGRAGHSFAILSALGQGTLYAFDKDPEAIAYENFNITNLLKNKEITSELNFYKIHDSFANYTQYINQPINGILLDLGVSSPQLDDAARGFSFMHDGPLDMRMNPTQGQSVAQALHSLTETELAEILWLYGEEKQSKKIAKAIKAHLLKQGDITNTLTLANLIANTLGFREKKHPATRSFQALRIYVNAELEDLKQLLATALQSLAPGGRMVVISFHSLEDRIVKQMFKQYTTVIKHPVLPSLDILAPAKLLPKIKPDALEIETNVRSRSAVMRVLEKL